MNKKNNSETIMKNFREVNDIPPYEVWDIKTHDDKTYGMELRFEKTVQNFMRLIYNKFLKEK